VAGFDIIYATLDVDFDRGEGLRSLPARFGKRRALAISLAFHVVAFALLCVLYLTIMTGPLAALMLLAIGTLLVVEHRQASNVELAFFKVNAVLGFVVLGFVAAGVLA
jgi:4-hydroxybenzoate polyprenyltransferase